MNAPTVMHVSLYVRDLDRTMAFYNAFFDREPEKVEPGYIKYHLDEPALVISFIQKPERVQAHFGRLGFGVDSPAALERRLAGFAEGSPTGRTDQHLAYCAVPEVPEREFGPEVSVEQPGRNRYGLLLCGTGQVLGHRSGRAPVGSLSLSPGFGIQRPALRSAE